MPSLFSRTLLSKISTSPGEHSGNQDVWGHTGNFTLRWPCLSVCFFTTRIETMNLRVRDKSGKLVIGRQSLRSIR